MNDYGILDNVVEDICDQVAVKATDFTVEDSELNFLVFQLCGIKDAEGIDRFKNSIDGAFDNHIHVHRSGEDDPSIKVLNARMESLGRIFEVFEKIEGLSDVERMVIAANYHATNEYKNAEIHAMSTGLSVYTYRAMTAQRIINWGK